MGEAEANESSTQTLDPELDPKRRAAAVDGTGAPAKDVAGGKQAERRDDDEVLEELEGKHGRKDKGRGRARAGETDDERPARRGSPRRDPLADTKPITWTRNQRADPSKRIVGEGPKEEREDKDEEDEEEEGRGRGKARARHQETPRRGKGGKFLKGESGPEREYDDDDRDQDEDEDQPEVDEERAEELTRARRALRRDGWTDDELDELTDDAIMRVGQHRARNQRDIDRQFAAKGRERRQGFTRQPEEERTPDTREHPRTGHDDEEELGELTATLTEALVDEDLSAKTAKAIAKHVAAVTKRNGAADTSGSDELLNELLDERAKARLGERFPALKGNRKLWERVASKAEVFHSEGVKNGEYEPGLAGIDEAFEDAARALLGDPGRARERRDDRRALRAARDNGAPSAPASKKAMRYDRVKTRDELDDLWLDARERNDREAMEEIQAMYEQPRFRGARP